MTEFALVLRRRYHVGILSVLRRLVGAVAFSVAATAVHAKNAELCGTPVGGLEANCATCTALLAAPDRLDWTSLSSIPAKARRKFAFPKPHGETLGFRKTADPRISVVYDDQTPACESLIAGVDCVNFVGAIRDWRQALGEGFVTRSAFEPQSGKRMDRAFAAAFPAARRDDGHVMEITLNWNLSEGLTRQKVASMPWRKHTIELLSKEAN